MPAIQIERVEVSMRLERRLAALLTDQSQLMQARHGRLIQVGSSSQGVQPAFVDNFGNLYFTADGIVARTIGQFSTAPVAHSSSG